MVGKKLEQKVAPLVGAWIEIEFWDGVSKAVFVAPLVGAWIEITSDQLTVSAGDGRSPRGSVD